MKNMLLHLNPLFSELKHIWPSTWVTRTLLRFPLFLLHCAAYWKFISELMFCLFSFSCWWCFSFGVNALSFQALPKLGFANFDCNFKDFLTPMCCILEVHILNCCFAHFLSFLLMVFLICCQRSIFSSIDKSWDLQRSIDR